MNSSIPAFSLSEILRPALNDHTKQIDYFVASFAWPMQLSLHPHRASYFGVALCTQGSATLLADLETYTLLPGSLIVMGPETIRSWKEQAADYAEEILFFSESFILKKGIGFNVVEHFAFFQSNAGKVIGLDQSDQNLIIELLRLIKTASNEPSLRRDEIMRNYISIMLNRVADIYDKYQPIYATANNSQTKMVNEFKKLLIDNHLQLRTVNGYADLLNVSAKHLSETIKEVTGKTASEWIQDILILEAKVRLKQSDMSVAAIATALNFGDPSLFGKYFRRYTGYSPAVYRKKG